MIGTVKAEMKDPKTLWADPRICNEKSAIAFARMFKRSVGQEIMVRASKWGKKRGATHVEIETICGSGKRMLQRGVEFGFISPNGKILKIPRQLNLKGKRLLERPLFRKNMIRKPGRRQGIIRRK